MADPPQFTGLLDIHRKILFDFFPAYRAASDNKDRRRVALRAAETVATKCNITATEDRTRLNNSVINFLYDRLVRESSSNVERYGFLKKTEGRYLFADSIKEKLKEEIAFEKSQATGSKHHLTIYQNVLTRNYEALSPEEIEKWDNMAEQLNLGTGTGEMKSMYGDMVFKEFTSAVLDSAQQWFDANMIILSCRPSIALNTKHAIAIKETNPKDPNQEKFLDRKMNEWSWNVREYEEYWRQLVGEERADIKYIFFASDGEPLLHPLDFFPQTEIRKKVLQRYFTTHYILATGDYSAAPPYSEMIGNGWKAHIGDEYLPLEAKAAPELHIRKPSAFRAQECVVWITFLLARQARMLAGEAIKPFRWTAVKAMYVGQPGKGLVAAVYATEFMRNYAPDSSSRSRIASAVMPASRLSATPSNTPLSRATTPPASPPVSTPTPASKLRELTISTPAQSRVRSTRRIETPSSSSSSSAPSPIAASPVAASIVAPLVAAPSPVAAPSVIAPQTLPVEGAIPPDFDTLLATFANVPVVDAVPNVPGIVAPSWCEGIAARKHAYLIDLSKNHHYRLIVDWYIAQKVSPSTLAPLADWLSWNYDSPHLPSTVHASKAKVVELLSHLSNWCKSPTAIFEDAAQLEAHLLLFGLMYRDMDLALYEFDPDGGGYERPAYLIASTISEPLFVAAGNSFAFLAQVLPAGTSSSTPASQPADLTLAPAPADNIPSSVTGGIQAAIAQKSKPKPRRPARKTKDVDVPMATPVLPETNDSITPNSNPQSTRDVTPASNSGDDAQAVRRGSRDRHAPKRFDDSESDEPTKKKKGARGGAKGGRSRAK